MNTYRASVHYISADSKTAPVMYILFNLSAAARRHACTNVSAEKLDSTHQLEYTSESVWVCDLPGTCMILSALAWSVNTYGHAGLIHAFGYCYLYIFVYMYKYTFIVMDGLSSFLTVILDCQPF